MSTDSDHLASHAADGVCHLQTTGRVSGRPRTIEIWFGVDGMRLYLLAGGRDQAHWVRNLRANPSVRVRLGGRSLDGQAPRSRATPRSRSRDACSPRSIRAGARANR